MSRGEKSSYSARQKRQAKHIEEGYASRGVSPTEAEARAWATVNKQSGGGELSGSGRNKIQTAKRADHKGLARDRRSASPSLAAMSRDELMQIARERETPGRSRMRKAELLQALG